MTLHKAIEAAREVLQNIVEHEQHLHAAAKFPSERFAEQALSTLPAKPPRRIDIYDLVCKVYEKNNSLGEVLDTLRDAGVLYVAESGE